MIPSGLFCSSRSGGGKISLAVVKAVNNNIYQVGVKWLLRAALSSSGGNTRTYQFCWYLLCWFTRVYVTGGPMSSTRSSSIFVVGNAMRRGISERYARGCASRPTATTRFIWPNPTQLRASWSTKSVRINLSLSSESVGLESGC